MHDSFVRTWHHMIQLAGCRFADVYNAVRADLQRTTCSSHTSCTRHVLQINGSKGREQLSIARHSVWCGISLCSGPSGVSGRCCAADQYRGCQAHSQDMFTYIFFLVWSWDMTIFSYLYQKPKAFFFCSFTT